MTTKGKDKVVIFPTCFVNYNNPNLGLIAKEIFQKLEIEHKFFYDVCCGMPQLEGGDITSVLESQKKLALNLENILTKVTKLYLLFHRAV